MTMKLEITELIEAVKDELLCIEGVDESLADKWESEFYIWLQDEKKSKKDVMEQKGKKYFRIQDEDEIFEMADSYLEAIEEGQIKRYWEKF